VLVRHAACAAKQQAACRTSVAGRRTLLRSVRLPAPLSRLSS